MLQNEETTNPCLFARALSCSETGVRSALKSCSETGVRFALKLSRLDSLFDASSHGAVTSLTQTVLEEEGHTQVLP